jgi:hypothetical protein
MKSYNLFKYHNYTSGAAGIDFSSYYLSHPGNQTPEKVIEYLEKNLSSNIKTIINFGCASGRDFIPFQDNYTCVGFDIAPVECITWVCKTDNLVYYECSIEDFLLNIDSFKFDWPNTLVYTQGTLMYVSHEEQNIFVEILLKKGCKNIVLQEYEPGNSGHHPYLNLNENNLKLFEKKLFRETHHHNPIAHLYLNKN